MEFEIDWAAVDEHEIVSKKMQEWVKARMFEYLGEGNSEANDVTEFVCDQLLTHQSAEMLLDEVKVFLDAHAEGFLVKLWRRFIFEILHAKAET